jgi:excisionase family DNA binding protein
MSMQRAKTMLRVSEAAEELGLRQTTLRDWLLKRKIGYVKVGSRAVRVPRTEVDRVISEGTMPARAPRR